MNKVKHAKALSQNMRYIYNGYITNNSKLLTRHVCKLKELVNRFHLQGKHNMSVS